MKKKLFFAAIAIMTMASCSDDNYVGDQEALKAGSEGAISFVMKTPAVTRASGSAAATLLNNNFVLFGYKSTNTTVFDNYQVNWVDNTAGSTESNSANWEYVGYKNLPFGTTTTSGGELNDDGVAANATASSTNIIQSIKYWDFSAGTYDFFAYSLGTGSAGNYAKASALSAASTYTLSGTQAELGTCYISKKNHKTSLSSSTTEVDLTFVNFLSKIQLKFYETIPGYSVKDVKFYVASDTKSTGDAANDGLAPALYTASTIPTAGTYTISFDASYDPVVTLSSATTTINNIAFPAVSTSPSNVWLSDYAGRDYKETDETVYLGRTSSTATASKQIDVLPNSTGTVLTLKMDYTLLSRDGSGETIEISGANATIPADYTKWKSNYAYTYIFKISDNTNGETLYPITLDAIVTDAQDGSQTTITTVATPSITTYQSGAIANEYNAGNIYVVVGDGSTALTEGTNAKLYTATVETGAAQGIAGDGSVAITEEMAANALTKTVDGSGNYVLTDANGKKLTVTPVSSEAADKLVGGLTAIPAADAPGGKELAVKCASFNAADNKVYVFEFISRDKATGTFVSGTTYYNDGVGGSTVNTSGFEVGTTDVSSYYIGDPKKYYKVIKVGTPTTVTP